MYDGYYHEKITRRVEIDAGSNEQWFPISWNELISPGNLAGFIDAAEDFSAPSKMFN